MSQNALGWVLNAYTLTFAGFLLLGGRAADLWGRRRLFLIGVALFSLTSLLGGLAQSGGELIGARALQGLGGAVLSPATLTILTTTFTEPRARARALGMWSAVAGAGGATGVLAGGVLTDLLSWRWILFINVPIGIAVFLVARFAIAESKGEGERPTLDWGGAVTVTGGLVAVVYGIVSTDSHSWGSGLVLGYLAAGIALLGAFFVIETRHRHPLVPLRLFRSRNLTGANLIMVILGSVMFSLFFFLSQFVQEVQGYSPLADRLRVPADAAGDHHRNADLVATGRQGRRACAARHRAVDLRRRTVAALPAAAGQRIPAACRHPRRDHHLRRRHVVRADHAVGDHRGRSPRRRTGVRTDQHHPSDRWLARPRRAAHDLGIEGPQPGRLAVPGWRRPPDTTALTRCARPCSSGRPSSQRRYFGAQQLSHRSPIRRHNPRWPSRTAARLNRPADRTGLAHTRRGPGPHLGWAA